MQTFQKDYNRYCSEQDSCRTGRKRKREDESPFLWTDLPDFRQKGAIKESIENAIVRFVIQKPELGASDSVVTHHDR